MYMHNVKSTLVRVSNPMYRCINSVFHELCHKSAMNIISRPSVADNICEYRYQL